jgi:hypothetical protein
LPLTFPVTSNNSIVTPPSAVKIVVAATRSQRYFQVNAISTATVSQNFTVNAAAPGRLVLSTRMQSAPGTTPIGDTRQVLQKGSWFAGSGRRWIKGRLADPVLELHDSIGAVVASK